MRRGDSQEGTRSVSLRGSQPAELAGRSDCERPLCLSTLRAETTTKFLTQTEDHSKLPVVPWKPLRACLASHFITRVPL
jgi:hypothetical protein